MERPIHTLSDLFRQLGLPDQPQDIEQFIARHRPLVPETALADAPFWQADQATFLREEVAEDADWAELVDLLSALLRVAPPEA